MSEGLRPAILEAASQRGEQGVAMGTIVDAMIDRGYRAEEAELALWELLGERLLTPSGFVCRMIRRRADGEAQVSRAYELLLIPWSPDDDRQLDLNLARQG
ncbi:MAG: hypothetical protein KC420_06480 [Myxococcales bacterium]|nr:hypothetical protein [Myxococcales bacterium]MCB9568644.1 hypothetical protein [Myxococcales bacterium]MCB9705981.1 hypothetical protein [Myxococcales bacterium]